MLTGFAPYRAGVNPADYGVLKKIAPVFWGKPEMLPFLIGA